MPASYFSNDIFSVFPDRVGRNSPNRGLPDRSHHMPSPWFRVPKFSCQNPIGADWSGLERTGADIGTAPAGGDAIFAPVSEEKSAMQGWNTLVVQPPIGEDGELAEPEAPDAPPARPQLPALPAKAELRDAEVHAMLGELDFGESAVMGDATAEERQAIANFDIRAFA